MSAHHTPGLVEDWEPRYDLTTGLDTHHFVVRVQVGKFDDELFQARDGSLVERGRAEVMGYAKARREAAFWRELGYRHADVAIAKATGAAA